MSAASLGAATVVQVTVRSLISSIGTISLTITHADQGNAVVCGVRVGTPPGALLAWLSSSFASVFSLALITAITTVILAITDVRLEHTLVIVTLEVVGGTVHGATGGGLVTLVLAVSSAITVPTLGYTDATLLTLELGLSVALVGGQHWTPLLITPVITVWDTITLVRLVDTLLQIATLELGGGAGNGWTPTLISVVETIIVSVTSPGLGDAGATALAPELEILAVHGATGLTLVRQVSTVILSVTLPGERNTPTIATPELRRFTRDIGTSGLI